MVRKYDVSIMKIFIPAILCIASFIFIMCKNNSADNSSLLALGLGQSVCSPETSALIIYKSGRKYTGGLGGRMGANDKCNATELPGVAKYGTITEGKAFLSFSATGEIQDIPSLYGYATDVPIYGPSGCKKIADDWGNLLDGSIDITLEKAGILESGEDWWSGSSSHGVFLGDSESCTGFTYDGYDPPYGRMGSTDRTDGLWLTNLQNRCNVEHYILCIAEFTPAP